MLDVERIREQFPVLVMPDIDMDRLRETLWFHATDNKVIEVKIVEAFIDGFADWLQESLGLKAPIKIEFEEITSPKFYNFETDRIFAKLPESMFRLMRARLAKEAPGKLEEQFHEMFTSRDGFHSHYPNQVPDKALREWDHNELYALVCAWVEHTLEGERLDWFLFEDMYEAVYHAVDEGTDWPRLEEEATDMYNEWVAAHEPGFVPPVPRCQYTPELPGIR